MAIIPEGTIEISMEHKVCHMIQSFAPGEVSYEEAHHFCAADNINHDKYHDYKQSYYRIRKLSDEY